MKQQTLVMAAKYETGFEQHRRPTINLADFACEEALYDITSLHHFSGIDMGCEAVPDATTLLKFRRLLESTTSMSDSSPKSDAYSNAAV